MLCVSHDTVPIILMRCTQITECIILSQVTSYSYLQHAFLIVKYHNHYNNNIKELRISVFSAAVH